MQGAPIFKNIGATEDDGMRSVRSRAKRGRTCGGEHLEQIEVAGQHPLDPAGAIAAPCRERGDRVAGGSDARPQGWSRPYAERSRHVREAPIDRGRDVAPR